MTAFRPRYSSFPVRVSTSAAPKGTGIAVAKLSAVNRTRSLRIASSFARCVAVPRRFFSPMQSRFLCDSNQFRTAIRNPHSTMAA
jgi:hypothetical protein